MGHQTGSDCALDEVMSFQAVTESNTGTSVAVQWLKLQAPNAGGTGLIPGQGTKILHAARHEALKQNKKKKARNTATRGL